MGEMIMQGQWVTDIWRGYLVLQIRGGDIPAFLNLAHARQIPLWNIQYQPDNSLYVYTYVKEFWRLRPLMRMTRCKVRIRKRVGFPFWIHKATRRKMFVAGFACFLLALYGLTSVIWSVKIEGTQHISPESVQAALRTIGIYQGAWKRNVGNLDAMQSRLLELLPQLSWAGIQVHGTSVIVQVVEKKQEVTKEPTAPQHIVAKKPGTVSQVLASKGKVMVQKGQTVYPGEVLISGNIGLEKPVAASGIVKAQVWYTSKVEVPLQVVHQSFTGEKVKRDYLLLHSFPIQVWGYGQLPFTQYEEISHDTEWHIGGWKLPVQLRLTEYYQVQQETLQLTPEQARAQAMKLIQDDVTAKMDKDGRILKQDVLQEKQAHGKLYMEVLTEVEENIGTPQPFATNSPQASPSQ
jgi:similar to stage IV sporulation protein